MSYLDKLDSHMRECCGVLSVEEQVRSGFRTKGEVNKTAKILFREFGKKTKSKRTRNKKTGEEECCCCSVEAIAKSLVPPSRKELNGDRSIQGRAFKVRSRGGNRVPIRITTADAGNQTFVATTEAGSNAVAEMVNQGTLAVVGTTTRGAMAVRATTEAGSNAIAEMVNEGTMAGVGTAARGTMAGAEMVNTGVQYADNGAVLVSAPPSYQSSVLFSDAPSGLTGMTDPFSGLGQGPNYTLSSYSSFNQEVEIESNNEDLMSEPDSLMEERAEIARMNALGEGELMELYNLGIIDLNQYAEGIEQMRDGIPLTEILQLGSRELDIGEGGEARQRGGRRSNAGRPTREQVEIARMEEMRPSEVRVVDRVVDTMIDDLEAEEDFYALAED